MAARTGGRVREEAGEILEEDREGGNRACSPALSQGPRSSHARATPRYQEDRAQGCRCRQSGPAALDWHCRLARRAGGARGESACDVGLGTRTRQGQREDPLRRDRQRPLQSDRPMAPHQGRHCRAPSLAQQPQDRSGRGSGASIVAGHAARHGGGSRRRASRHGRLWRGNRARPGTPQTRMAQDPCDENGQGCRGRARRVDSGGNPTTA